MPRDSGDILAHELATPSGQICFSGNSGTGIHHVFEVKEIQIVLQIFKLASSYFLKCKILVYVTVLDISPDSVLEGEFLG